MLAPTLAAADTARRTQAALFQEPVPALVHESPRTHWLPYRVTAGVFAAALLLNAFTGNGLWMAYTLVGTTVFSVVVGLVRHHDLRIPPMAVWMVGLAAGLHYAGGSMGGVHQIGGLNGLYHVFPWWDNTVHALGSAAVAVAAVALLDIALPTAHRALVGFLGLAVAALVGVLVELYEFAQFVFFGTVDQGFYTNTLLDLYYNLIGATLAVVLYGRWSRVRPARPDATTSTASAHAEAAEGSPD